MSVEEDCCHPTVEVMMDYIVSFEVDIVIIEVYEICLVCNKILEQYQITYKAE